MRVVPSGINGIELAGSGSPVFHNGLKLLGQIAPDKDLKTALRYSAIVINRTDRFIALLGMRFDMTLKTGKACSVVHYADTLRYPEQASIAPGSARLVCAEPYYSDRVLGREPAAREAAERARMNIENLRFGKNHRACLDCVAFADGEFLGPDTRGAFERIAAERTEELELINAVLGAGDLGALLERELLEPEAPRTRRTLALRLKGLLENEGEATAVDFARNHRPRSPLWRPAEAAPDQAGSLVSPVRA
jgi:hypothetical protein